MVSIYEILDRLGPIIADTHGFRVQVVSLYMHRELAILYKEHKRLRLFLYALFLLDRLRIVTNFILLSEKI